MWDTAGQERYETITTQYYRRAHGIILVYDITRQETFNNIRKWLRYVDEHANNNVQRLLLANKCDAEDERKVWKDQGARAFTEICRQILQAMDENNQNGTMLSPNGESRSSAILLDTKNEVLPRSSCCY